MSKRECVGTTYGTHKITGRSGALGLVVEALIMGGQQSIVAP